MNRIDEVDLGRSARDVNLARTQAAMERAKVGQPPAAEESKLSGHGSHASALMGK